MSLSNFKKKKGFTLVELMVAIAIFSIVMTISMGALLAVVNVNRTAQALQSVMDNLNFALDSFSRTVRTGNSYSCSEPVSGKCLGITLVDKDGKNVSYRFNSVAGSIERRINGGDAISITAPEIKIKNLEFVLSDTVGGNLLQPRIFMVLQGTATTHENTKANFDLQTTISERQLDL